MSWNENNYFNSEIKVIKGLYLFFDISALFAKQNS